MRTKSIQQEEQADIREIPAMINAEKQYYMAEARAHSIQRMKESADSSYQFQNFNVLA